MIDLAVAQLELDAKNPRVGKEQAQMPIEPNADACLRVAD